MRINRRLAAWTAALGIGVLTLAGCDGDSTGVGGTGRVTVLLTDAPAELLASAEVSIGRIELIRTGGAPITLTEEGGTYDLLELSDGVTAELASLDIEAGMYHQLRMVVSAATLTLKEEYSFADGSQSKELFVPSGAQTGIKINLSSAGGDASGAGVEISSGETVLVVDFDVTQNFKLQGDADSPAGIQGFLFTPLLRAAVRDVAGTISGTISVPATLPAEGLTVTAEAVDPPTGEENQTFAATAITDADGDYTLHFLPPGEYRVQVEAPDGFVADPVERLITVGEAEAVTGADFELAEDTN